MILQARRSVQDIVEWPVGVIPGRTQFEHIESALPPKSGHLADMPSPPLRANRLHARGFDLSLNKHVLGRVLGAEPSPERLSDKFSGKAAAGLGAATAFSLRAQTAAATGRVP